MANPEHLEMLNQGVKVWNEWREENRSITVDLSQEVFIEHNLRVANLRGAILRGAILQEANLHDANLHDANLHDANLQETYLGGAYLRGANLRGAIFIGDNLSEANLIKADLSGADLREVILSAANFTNSKLIETNFEKSVLDETVFGLTDLSTCKGLDSVKVSGKCIVDFETLQKSKLPRSFLLKIGLPEIFIEYLPEFVESPINLFPVFLSHSWGNKEFAGKLYEALIDKGVQVWYDEKKMKPGDDIYEGISKGISTYDKMILVCSKESLSSWWVDQEMNRVFAKERKYTKEKGEKINLLIPVTIDDYVYDWDGTKSEDIKRFVIGDFQEWQNEEKFNKALNKLIAALNVNRGGNDPISFLDKL